MFLTLDNFTAVLDSVDAELKKDIIISNIEYKLDIRVVRESPVYKLSYRGLAKGRPTKGYKCFGSREDLANFLEVRI